MPGWRLYDHRPAAAWPEYAAVARAIDDFAQRANHEEGVALKQTQFEAMLVDLARAACAGDCCPDCDPAGGTDWRPCAPYAVEPDRDGITARYRCAHGHEWTSWWASRDEVVMLP